MKDVNTMLTWRCCEGPFVGSRSPNVQGWFDGPNINHVWLGPNICKSLCLFEAQFVDHWLITHECTIHKSHQVAWVELVQSQRHRAGGGCFFRERSVRNGQTFGGSRATDLWLGRGALVEAQVLTSCLTKISINISKFLVLRCSERMRGLRSTIESSWISWNMLANSINPIHPKLHLRLFPLLAKSCWYWPIAWRIRDKASQINCGRWMPCTPSHPRQEMLGRSGEKMWKQGR